MIAFIDDHREAYGVEPICKVLPIAPSTYHAHIAQRIDASKRSARAQRDAELKIEVQRVFAENFGVYGVRKVWRQLRNSRRLMPAPRFSRRHRAPQSSALIGLKLASLLQHEQVADVAIGSFATFANYSHVRFAPIATLGPMVAG